MEAADYHMLLRMIRETKVPRDRFRRVLVVFLYVTKMFSVMTFVVLTVDQFVGHDDGLFE